jgi:hypothetical protein
MSKRIYSEGNTYQADIDIADSSDETAPAGVQFIMLS